MSVKKFAAEMRATIEEIKAKGTAAIDSDIIIAFLEEVEKSPEPAPTAVDMARFQAELQDWVDAKRSQRESDLEMFRSVITAGQGAIKSSFLLNGGAAFATLAFIGHLVEIEAKGVSAFATSLLLFAIGVLTIAVTSGFTYFSQWLYAHPKKWTKRAGLWANRLCIALGTGSYVLFAVGLYLAYFAFDSYS